MRIERYDHRPPPKKKKKKKVSRYVCVLCWGGEVVHQSYSMPLKKKRGRINIKSRHFCTGIGMAWYEKEKKKKEKEKVHDLIKVHVAKKTLQKKSKSRHMCTGIGMA